MTSEKHFQSWRLHYQQQAFFILYNHFMYSYLFTAILLLSVANSQFSRCPAANPLTIAQGSLTVAQGGLVPLQSGIDVQCYNFTLSTTFNCTPSVAVAVNDLQSQFSSSLFFSIKVLPSDQYSIIPFVIRTQWGYTRWSRISFSFVAEASAQLQAGYYQIDTSTLAACFSGKQIVAFIPFQNQNPSFRSAITFLNGFEISSMSINSTYRTPYQIALMVSEVTPQGITLTVQSTSATQVHSLFVSYITYDSNIQNLVAGTYLYNRYSATNQLQFRPPIGVSNNNIAFHGFSSFIARNSFETFDLRGSLVNGNLSFTSSSSLYYLSYSYFFLIGGPCGQCPGFSINFNGTCVATCPPNSFFNGNTCIVCEPGFIWNGSQCINRCSSEQIWDQGSQRCVCPPGQNWNGNNCITCRNGQVWFESNRSCACGAGANWNGFVCITCTSGQVWDAQSFSCICPSNSFWNKFTCVTCPSGQIWNSNNLRCVCPQGANWNGTSCVTCSNGFVWNSQLNGCGCNPGFVVFRGSCALIPTCGTGQTLDVSSNTCVCLPGTNWNGFTCITCTNGQIWNTQQNSCTCPRNTNWNGYSCVSCPSGQIWSTNLNACSCPPSQNWNGFACVSCDGGRTWNSAVNSCACPSGQNWNGVVCVRCNPGSNWNGVSCITCSQGQVWNEANTVCQCPSGQQWNGNACVTPCPSGMININGLCSCPSGTYLSNGSCIRQPTCPSGQTWDGLRCTQIQCPPGTSWNGTICTSTPAQNCPAGTFYDGTRCVTNTTNCPQGTSWNGSSCQSSGSCPNGTFSNGGTCTPISQLCPVGLVWQNTQCVPTGTSCPNGTYFSRGSCIPFQPCNNGRVWNSTVSQCVCPQGSFWNGNICIQCSNGQSYQINSGCFCPQGTFLSNGSCTPIQVNQCASVANSLWNGVACVCNPGYSVIGLQCVCQGLAVSPTFCDRCASKPNSTWINGICQCNQGLSDINGRCVIPPPNPTPNATCNVATYFDNQQKRCLPCTSGCLSCTSCYECTSCQPGFYMDFFSSLCVEVCGDARRFTLQCDDGNNVDGDGCSSDCQVQVGFTCVGGSPNSRDTCSKTLPQALTFESTGQSRLFGKIILNVRANYLPLSLIQSATDCSNKCNNVLSVTIVSGDRSTTGIVASYIPSTSFSFSIEIDFGRQPIGMFTAQVGINPNLVQRYFSGINTSNRLSINVNPAFMARYIPPGDVLT